MELHARLEPHAELEAQIDRWRGYVQRRQAISAADVDELEDHLREQVANWRASGLDDEEAFLVAIKRLGNLDAVSREFAHEHADRLWKQLALVPPGDAGAPPWRELAVVLALAVGVGVAVKAGTVWIDDDGVLALGGAVLIGLTFAVLVLVLSLLLYSISARNSLAPPGLFDALQLGLVVAALAVDAVMLTAMLTRIAELGSSPNRIAALGLNLLLLVHLVGAAGLTVACLRGRRPFTVLELERWHTRYLPLYGAWAAVVVLLFPLIFGFA